MKTRNQDLQDAGTASPSMQLRQVRSGLQSIQGSLQAARLVVAPAFDTGKGLDNGEAAAVDTLVERAARMLGDLEAIVGELLQDRVKPVGQSRADGAGNTLETTGPGNHQVMGQTAAVSQIAKARKRTTRPA